MAFCFCWVWLLLARALPAQVDPRGPVRTIRTTHFRVHFATRLDSVARMAAVYAEGAYGQLAGELHEPKLPIDLLIADNVDFSNGYAQLFPTPRVVIYATPPVASQELRYTGDWLRTVITHELAHVFHIDRARGLWAVGRALFGRSPALFPNSYTPSWVKEGLAVYFESKFTAFGRDISTEFPTMLRAAAADSALMPMGRWSLSSTRFPRGNAAYLYGSVVMARAAATAPAGKGMRRYVDVGAAVPIPYLLQTNARAGFGQSFAQQWRGLEDSLRRLPQETRADGITWESPDGYYASTPRWLSPDSLLWTASNGRDITGLYTAQVGHAPVRVARRNGLDANVPVAGGVLYAQLEYRDPYTTRSDLYWQDRGAGRARGRERWGSEQRLTVGARLAMPDVRRDGEIVAVRIEAGSTSLVRVSRDGRSVRTLALGAGREMWSEPRWSPSGEWIAAVQLLGTGEQRIMLLDTLGNAWQAVAGGRGVFASPSFTPDGQRLVWASDRSGRMQLETARLGEPDMLDTTRWREPREEVQQITRVNTGVYEPTVSPDGRHVAVLVQRGDGMHAAVLPLDTVGVLAEARWYTREALALPPVDSARIVSTAATGYRAARMLLPRYWLPSIGAGRDGRSTYGLTSSSSDILGRHTWEASALVQPERREVDGYALYHFAGFGVPVFDLSVSQQWDATFRVVNDSNATLGFVARRKRFATVSSTVSVPRVRWAASASLGAQLEWRDFTATVDSALGPANSLLRTGVRYPTLFVNTSIGTGRRALRSVSVEEGVTLSTSSAYRWRFDAPALGSWRHIVSGRAYAPLNLPGFSRHVVALRATAGVTDEHTASEFSVGGVSGQQSELLPGVTIGDPSRSFAVRGVAPGVQRGIRAVSGSAEYRAPLHLFSRAPSPFTVFTDKVSVALFTDAGRAWCPAAFGAQNALICPTRARDGIVATAGGELVVDIALAYDVPYRLRLGAAAPYAAPAAVPRRAAMYVSLGGYF